MNPVLSRLRVAAATFGICVVGYTGAILGFAQAVKPDTANGSLIVADGKVICSHLIAQGFSAPQYVWLGPSAVDYGAGGARGSNLSPANPALADRAADLIAAHRGGAAAVPADLVTASGGGLDPNIAPGGAIFQALRVADARGVDPAAVAAIIDRLALRPGGMLTPDRIVNVLVLNLTLDAKRHRLRSQTGFVR
ncbi:K+-transporting ATPase ATPase C chain [Loktanella fryxellensis]|uniref:Potassium-transporting ATPase KdpC subunit n=1 Tax=Loktanella fryxellensis TaxID=245187 RepID=A0A1H8JBW8_9RHOB|nr:potassium-transporting ATPase subunit C [Loktanella fryxellensis]SEN77618.1 K+-transporting ATPase ATPase C chain [Loktanella fryxellensis]